MTPTNSIAALKDAMQRAFLEANQKSNEADQKTKGASSQNAATNAKIQQWLTEYNEFAENYEGVKRELHSDTKAKMHVEQTRKTILAGADHLNKGQSVVVVFDPKFYGPDDEPVEPLDQLLKKCKQLVLVSSSQATLDKLKVKLGNNPKVVTHVSDWTGGITRNIARVGAEVELLQVKDAQEARFVCGVRDALDASKPKIEADKLLAKIGAEKVDYVVSSLVPFDAFTSCIDAMDFVYSKIFKYSSQIVAIKPDFNKGIYFRLWTLAKQGRACDVILKFDDESDAINKKLRDDLFPKILSSHVDLTLSLVRPKSGRVFFSDTTKVLKKERNPSMVEKESIFVPYFPKLQTISPNPKTSFWCWNYKNSSYKVQHWLWTNIKKGTKLLEANNSASAVIAPGAAAGPAAGPAVAVDKDRKTIERPQK